MRTEIVTLDPGMPEPATIERAAEVLRRGGVVAFPTETVYGLGANALDATAVARIFAAKGRPATNPLIVHVLDATAAQALATEWPAAAARLAARFWPGPLTLVLPKQAFVPDITTAGGPTVAVRVPSHPIARALIEAAGVPLAAPSANRSTHISTTTAAHVKRSLDGRIELILDGGPTSGGLESTVLDLTCDPPRILRPGLLAASEIESELGLPVIHAAGVVDEAQTMASPGMMSRHYAPSVPLECVDGSGRERVEELLTGGNRVGWLTLGAVSAVIPPCAVHRALASDAVGYASGLYAALHELEAAGVQRIVVSRPPQGPEWAAIHDRLRRAGS